MPKASAIAPPARFRAGRGVVSGDWRDESYRFRLGLSTVGGDTPCPAHTGLAEVLEIGQLLVWRHAAEQVLHFTGQDMHCSSRFIAKSQQAYPAAEAFAVTFASAVASITHLERLKMVPPVHYICARVNHD